VAQSVGLDVHGLGPVGLFGLGKAGHAGQGREQKGGEDAVVHRARILQFIVATKGLALVKSLRACVTCANQVRPHLGKAAGAG
jgi:hypothetical protein